MSKTGTFVFLLASFIDMVKVMESCPPFQYHTGIECCPMCNAGNVVKTDCTEFTGTTCKDCPAGTFMDLPNGLKDCYDCTVCSSDSGVKTATPCTSTRNATCEPLEGFFCAVKHCVEAQRHQRCRPGQYIKLKGTASSDTECSDCSDGTFSDGTFTTCQPHRKCDPLIKNGTASADAECEKAETTLRALIWTGAVVLVLIVTTIVVLLIVCRGGKESQKEWLKEILAHYTKEKKIGLGAEGDIAIETVRLREGP